MNMGGDQHQGESTMENTKTTKTITLTDYQWGILHDVLCDRLDGECGGDIYEEVLVIIQEINRED